MAMQIIMDYSGDSRHQFNPENAEPSWRLSSASTR